MHKYLNDYRSGILDVQRMLRLPVGPEFWGAAGPHQIHDLPPLGMAAACRWAWGAGRGVADWAIAGLRRRAAKAGPEPHPAPLAR